MPAHGTKSAAIALAILLCATAGAVAQTRLDLNTATVRDLEKLPGVSPDTARKIVAGRPYSSVADLNRAGLSKHRINKFAQLVTVTQPSTRLADHESTPAPLTPETAGMVWADKDTKVYHRAGDPLYGETAHGKYMTERDALDAGYRAASK